MSVMNDYTTGKMIPQLLRRKIHVTAKITKTIDAIAL
jgi:hypothetical protein